MTQNTHSELVGLIWNIANKLRGPYRPPQYRKVMLPMIVLRRLDCVLEENHEKVAKKYEQLKASGKYSDDVIDKMLAKTASGERKHPLYNTSNYTFRKLIADSENIARNLVAYINGFSPKAREIFEKFKFEDEIAKLDEANRLFMIVREFIHPEDGKTIDLHPERVTNLQMGYVFEELVRKFNEQANEEAGDHFTPREVIRLMANLIYTDEEDVYKSGIIRTIYDPTCGTGGMLSVSEEHIREQNPNANLILFGQEYNGESYAICCSDLLIKDEPLDNIVMGDTLGDGKTFDGHPGKQFHYMLANPPFGVEWKPQKNTVEKEYKNLGFTGRFGPGLPRINDGALLFLLHMISKMHPSPANGGDGSKIAIVFNGSPLFTGDAGSGESNIRRWIIENDMLEAVVALPNQLFYNTGIYTYIWLVTNRKTEKRKGKVQLIDGTKHYQKMGKSLGDKRNELSDEHIQEITRLYGEFGHEAVSKFLCEGKPEEKIASKIFDNREFGYLKMTVERPLRLNFLVNDERIQRVPDQAAFRALVLTKKRRNKEEMEKEIEAGKALQNSIMEVLEGMKSNQLIMDRAVFEKMLRKEIKQAGLKLDATVQKAIVWALSERDPDATICKDTRGNPEPDPSLRDTELVPLADNIDLPLPMEYDKKAKNTELLDIVEDHCETYLAKEVLPHVSDAWIDHKKTKVGYEIPLNRHFYVFEPPRQLENIEKDIETIEKEILGLLKEMRI
ncbi:type I restriction-modification system subunit M [Draconibacterium halophilum]|uniref:site-specific DNA-methyltransferase (adenine-specific) n=1 Tax=Draconibacterium halophilum TaxID=2706887 RepID=A0A6C0RAU1_9BACT|nr:class I SAM-dependent DNA methyltransferase [Draconibacterium halophilum]QIA07126.1 SAM-dependent DNA methyltransferase [Draconibacterium halophilum]